MGIVSALLVISCRTAAWMPSHAHAEKDSSYEVSLKGNLDPSSCRRAPTVFDEKFPQFVEEIPRGN